MIFFFFFLNKAFFFKGTIQGNNFKVENIYIDKPGTNNLAIFMRGYNCFVSNIHFKNITVHGNDTVAALFSVLELSNLSNLSFENTTLSGTQRVGTCAGSITSSNATQLVVISTKMNATNSNLANDFGKQFFFFFFLHFYLHFYYFLKLKGGMFGVCSDLNLRSSGVVSANIKGYGVNGAICGALLYGYFDQIYVQSKH